jgi:hypothetical protein
MATPSGVACMHALCHFHLAYYMFVRLVMQSSLAGHPVLCRSARSRATPDPLHVHPKGYTNAVMHCEPTDPAGSLRPGQDFWVDLEGDNILISIRRDRL